MTLPGNCLVGFLWLKLTRAGKMHVLWKKPCPHILLRTSKGTYWHFKLVRDILPRPFCYVLFLGQFVEEKQE